MHGLFDRAIQSFVEDTYGRRLWLDVVRDAGLPYADLDVLSRYTDDITSGIIEELSRVLAKPSEEILEDIGTYLVTHPRMTALRRLLRFSGDTFESFLMSLSDAPARARMAVPDLEVPPLSIRDLQDSRYVLLIHKDAEVFADVILGLLRGMADDYGALAVLTLRSRAPELGVIRISVVDAAYAEGQTFDLVGAAAGS
ncbi:heme NO-binding domain-containing protein [Poseidonocella sedimentorum]|uniref:Haem-NO-binding n=1 Tax=Poseidonocella sedimentorum TaxID=871652 RepID=A0A1I6E0D8_9RHOB|nr:heme NO-binding domain-containing protein [Poseidonocella sedimentorum]SFR11135.1 Haem-NO-binding [Poseidonocella sedimentorum]